MSVIKVKGNLATCNGGGGALGHPIEPATSASFFFFEPEDDTKRRRTPPCRLSTGNEQDERLQVHHAQHRRPHKAQHLRLLRPPLRERHAAPPLRDACRRLTRTFVARKQRLPLRAPIGFAIGFLIFGECIILPRFDLRIQCYELASGL